MNKRKRQIEEMAHEMAQCFNCAGYGECFIKCKNFEDAIIKATRLINAGYRKLPKDVVVLTKKRQKATST